MKERENKYHILKVNLYLSSKEYLVQYFRVPLVKQKISIKCEMFKINIILLPKVNNEIMRLWKHQKGKHKQCRCSSVVLMPLFLTQSVLLVFVPVHIFVIIIRAYFAQINIWIMINYNCLTLYTLTSVSIFSILLYTFHLALTRRICLTIKASSLDDHLLLFSWSQKKNSAVSL